MERALDLVEGTMGLFSGFSVLSGVEILYYLAKYIGNSFYYKRKTQYSTNHKWLIILLVLTVA